MPPLARFHGHRRALLVVRLPPVGALVWTALRRTLTPPGVPPLESLPYCYLFFTFLLRLGLDNPGILWLDVPMNEDYTIDGTLSADTLEVGDQIIIEGDLCIIRKVDSDREDIDEVYVWVENLSGGDEEFALYADDYFDMWYL